MRLRGEFELTVVDAATGIVTAKRNFPNLVTNVGLEYWARRDYGGFSCVVGTGTNLPSAQDTSLQHKVAETGIGVSMSSGSSSASPYEAYNIFTGRFNAGTISTTISEIGVNMTAVDQLWCRQRILDDQGQPSAIAVLPNEYLDVAYTLYYYPNLTDLSFTFNMDGVAYSCVSRHARAPRTASTMSENHAIYRVHKIEAAYSTQQLGDITGEPSGAYVSGNAIGGYLQYDAGQRFTRSDMVTMDLSNYNVDGGIGSILVSDYYGLFYRQISFSPKLPKDANTVIRLVFSDTVSRYST